MLNPKKAGSIEEDSENKLLIEKWMKRNSSSAVTIGQDVVKSNFSSKEKNMKKVNSSNQKIGPKIKVWTNNQEKKVTIKKAEKRKSGSIIIKRINQPTSDDSDLSSSIPLPKIARQSLPVTRNELPSINKNISVTLMRRSDSNIQKSTLVKKVSKSLSIKLEQVKSNTKNSESPEEDPLKLTNSASISSNTAGIKRIENSANCNNNVKKILSKEKESDVYSSLLENYKYLIIPKLWSVQEFINETKGRHIIFYNIGVVKDNNNLITVVQKSLIIDKGAKIHYSVHGLPVNIKGTILPEILDNTKKLLSILHIFDKMQVCDGIGSDLSARQTDLFYKDNYGVWRHKGCKIVLIKATRCTACIEAKNLLLKKEIYTKKIW